MYGTQMERNSKGCDSDTLLNASTKYIEARKAKERYQRYYNQLLGMRPAERQEAMKLSHNMRTIADLKERLNRVRTVIDLSMLCHGDVVVKSIETGQQLNAEHDKVMIDEAVEVIMPGGGSFTLQPAGEDVVMLKRELLKRQMVCEDILERTQAKDAYDLRLLSENYEDLKRKMVVAKSEFEILLKELVDESETAPFEESKEMPPFANPLAGRGRNAFHIERESHKSAMQNERVKPFIVEDPDFDSFVAIDINTTGLSPERDSIVEIAAVKVVDGVVRETKEYAFDELVYPSNGTVSESVQALTGISEEKLRTARSIKDVVSDLLDFAGDDVLVGYNSNYFDTEFLMKAATDCGIPVMNSFFDVLQYLRANRNSIGYDRNDMKLNTVADYFGISSDKSYRCVDDALSTAKIYMKLKGVKK